MNIPDYVYTIPLAVIFVAMMVNFYVAPGKFYGKYPFVFKTTKTLLLPSIALIWAHYTKTFDLMSISWLFFHWLGDIALLFPGVVATCFGGLFFFLGHLGNWFYYAIDYTQVKPISFLICLPVSACLYFFVFRKITIRNAKDVGCLAYSIALQFSLFTAAARLCRYNITEFTFLCSWIGYIIFTCSDACLFLNEFSIVTWPLRIPIMSTYAIAEFLLMIGNVTAYKEVEFYNNLSY